MDEMTTCNKCGERMDVLDAFPGRICIKCHADKFDKQVAANGGQLPRPNFSKAFRV